jgi:membrane-associated protein
MELFYKILHLLANVDDKMMEFMANYGVWAYAILFAVIFAETGLVVAPFLPGDGLLFAVGIFTHGIESSFGLPGIIILLSMAAILGNTANYHIAKYVGVKLVERQKNHKLQDHLDKTHKLIDQYGGWALVIARFIPFARTFAPFVAGMGQMSYLRFQFYNVVGAFIWVGSCVLLGYFVGKAGNAHGHMLFFLIGIIVVSLLPVVYKYIKYRLSLKKNSSLI